MAARSRKRGAASDCPPVAVGVQEVAVGRGFTKAQLVELLFKFGWLVFKSLDEAKKVSSEHLASAVMAYQAFHGLDVDGWAGPQTLRSLTEDRFCGHPDRMEIGEGLGKWPDPRIRWWIDEASLSGIPVAASVVVDAYSWAWEQWAAVCGIRPERAVSQGQAHVRVRFAPIDGRGKTLAWSELANNQNTPKQQQYDNSETWVFSDTPQRSQIDLGRVACHEIGHVLGISHIATGNLLQPMYDVNIRVPQRGDVAEAQARYGPPVSPPKPPTAENFKIVIDGVGAVSSALLTGFKVEKVP